MKIERTLTGYNLLMTKRQQPAVKEMEALSSDRISVPIGQNGSQSYTFGNSLPVGMSYFATYNNINFHGKSTGCIFLREEKEESKDKKGNGNNNEDSDIYNRVVKETTDALGSDTNARQLFMLELNTRRMLAARSLVLQCNQLCLSQVNSLKDLSISQKKKYLSLLLACSATFMTKEFQDLYMGSNIVPKTSAEFMKILGELTGNSDKGKTVNERSTVDNEIFGLDSDIKLAYEKKDFIKDVQKLVSGLPETEKLKIWDYFGFELITLADGTVKLFGVPRIRNNIEKLSQITNPVTRKAILRIKPYIQYLNECNSPEPAARLNKSESDKNFRLLLSVFPRVFAAIKDKGIVSINVSTFEKMKQEIYKPEFQKLTGQEQIEKLVSMLTEETGGNQQQADNLQTV